MMFERYESYRDSGVEWLGEIPLNWGLLRLKDIAKIEGGKDWKQIATEDNEKYPVYGSGGIMGFATKYLYNKTSVLLGRKGTIDRPLIVNEPFWSVDTMYYTRIKNNFNPKWFYYMCTTMRFKFYQYGSAVPSMTQEDLSNNIFVAPNDISMTNVLATYLDQKTQAIDQEIALLEQKIATYKELKQTLINETVLRGFDKNVKLKESGVAWIGKIPEGWIVQRIATAFEERREKVSDVDYPPLSVTKKGIVPQLEHVAKTIHNDNRKLVIAGDFVINSRSDRRGSSGVAEIDGSVSVINIVLAPKKTFYGKYLHHMFRSYAFIEEFFRHGRGIAFDLWTTKYSVMKSIEFVYPDIDEQIKIANYLDEKIVKMDNIVQIAERKINLLKEFRKTLINDAVTGKIKVA